MISRQAAGAPKPFRPVPLLFAALLALLGGREAGAGGGPAIIDNGTIQLGVDSRACLNVATSGGGSEGVVPPIVGLRDLGTGFDSTVDGDPFEGWGIVDLSSGAIGGAASELSKSLLSVPFGLSLIGYSLSGSGTQPESDGRRVVTIHEIVGQLAGHDPEGPPPPAFLRVTHDFHPSVVPRLYEIEVTVENLTHGDAALRYRRTVDWDVEPETIFDTFATVHHGPSTAVVNSAGFGFQSPDPTEPMVQGPGAAPSAEGFTVPCPLNSDFLDCGPGDQGAAFDFQFPAVPPLGKLRFWLYYGAATNEANALSLLDTVGASAYSLGQSATNGTPVTFVLGFKAPWAIVDNGTVELGVDMFGSLNVHGGTQSSGSSAAVTQDDESRGFPPTIYITGLRNVGTNTETLAGGTPREGWGVVDLDTNTGSGTTTLFAGGLKTPSPEGSPPVLGFNMSPVGFEVLGAGTLAESVGRRVIVTGVIDDPPILRVIHDFRPSKTPNLYEVVVILENLSGAPIDPRYRRIADWDVEPGIGDDYVTIQYGGGAPVPHSSGNGFSPPNPLDAMFSTCTVDDPFTDCPGGGGDIGSALDFDLPDIPVGGREMFLLYYGTAFGEAAALDALNAVGAEAYALAENAPAALPEVLPPVFVFGFRDVLFVDDFETGDSTRWSNSVP